MHHRRPQLQVKVRLDPLLGHRLGDALAVATLELAREQVAKPALEQRDDAAQEEQPDAPHGRPEAHARPLTHGPGVEPVVNQVLQILAHADLAHQPVLVSVHAGELPDVRKDVLQAVRELECVHVPEAVLHVAVHHQLREAQNLAAQVERVAEPALLAFLGGERLHRLQVEVVVEVQVVQVLAVNQQVQHVVPLAAHLQPRLGPVQLRALEELGLLQRFEQRALLHRLRRALVQLVQDVALEQLLVGDANLHRVPRRAVFLEPAVHQRHVDGAFRGPAAPVKRLGREHQRDAVHGVLRVQGRLLRERVAPLRQREVVVVVGGSEPAPAHGTGGPLRRSVRRDGVDQRVVVECGQIRVLRLDVHDHRVVVRGRRHAPRAVVVQVWKRDFVFGAVGVTHDELVHVVELVPVLVRLVHVSVQRFELGTSRYAHVQRLGGEEALVLEEVEVVLVRQVAEQLPRQAVQRRHHGQRELPLAVARAVDELGVLQRLVLVEPLRDRAVLLLVQLELDRLQRVDIEQVVRVVQRRLFIVKGREAHPLEVPPVALLAAHHDPHRAPLRHVHRLDHARCLVHKRDRAGDVVNHLAVPRLLPRHRHVLQQFKHRVRHKLQSAQVHALVVPELARAHVAVVLHDLAHVLLVDARRWFREESKSQCVW